MREITPAVGATAFRYAIERTLAGGAEGPVSTAFSSGLSLCRTWESRTLRQ
jgi:hypothetical protein